MDTTSRFATRCRAFGTRSRFAIIKLGAQGPGEGPTGHPILSTLGGPSQGPPPVEVTGHQQALLFFNEVIIGCLISANGVVETEFATFFLFFSCEKSDLLGALLKHPVLYRQ